MPSADDVLSDSQDAFDNLISNRTNVLDLAAHYPYNHSSGSATATASDPGGYQLGNAILTPTGEKFKEGVSSSQLDAKRNLPRDDIAVVLMNVGSTGDVVYGTSWEQDW